MKGKRCSGITSKNVGCLRPAPAHSDFCVRHTEAKRPCDRCKSTRWHNPLRSVGLGLSGAGKIQIDYRAHDYPAVRDAKLCKHCYDAAIKIVDRMLS